MVHWSWLILAFYGGMLLAIVMLALCASAGRADRQLEEINNHTTKEVPS